MYLSPIFVSQGLGDYYRISPTNETIANYVRDEKLQFADSGYPTYSRAYRYEPLEKNAHLLFALYSFRLYLPILACSTTYNIVR